MNPRFPYQEFAKKPAMRSNLPESTLSEIGSSLPRKNSSILDCIDYSDDTFHGDCLDSSNQRNKSEYHPNLNAILTMDAPTSSEISTPAYHRSTSGQIEIEEADGQYKALNLSRISSEISMIRARNNPPNPKRIELPKGNKIKNLLKNYGGYLAKFVKSSQGKALVLPYFGAKESVYKEFYLWLKKKRIYKLTNLREALEINPDTDNQCSALFKDTLKSIYLLFIKKYSHNWVYGSGRLKDKFTHILLRRKLMRKIENPSQLTSLS
jgi:hypothetical protein